MGNYKNERGKTNSKSKSNSLPSLNKHKNFNKLKRSQPNLKEDLKV